MEIPSELDLMSFFCCDPKLLCSSENVIFYYNIAEYEFSNESQKFKVDISPSYQDLNIFVSDYEGNRLYTFNLMKIKRFEILSDTKTLSKALLTQKFEDFIQYYEITFKPKFSFIVKTQENF